MSAAIQPKLTTALRLRRRMDNTVYAYMCLNCGGASKIYHSSKVCYCGGLGEAMQAHRVIEGEWREVKWDGKLLGA